ncbi:MAG: M12 family metallopeptidase, partial [Polyangiaceae bacterium]
MAALAILLSAAACGAPQGEDEASSAGGPGPAGDTPLGRTPATTAAGKYRVWPDGRIPYRIDGSVKGTTRTRLLAAMKEWQTKSEQRVRFEEKDAGDAAFLDVVGSPGPLTSRVGYKAGTRVEMQLRNPEYITVIRHELGHVLGLHHEQRREDRGAHIQVRSANVVDTDHCKYQFSVCEDCVLLGGYNTKSVMHYRTSDLKSCRTGPVLLDKDDSPIDHVWVITSGDLLAIEELYGPAPEAADGAGGAGGSAGGAGPGGGDAGGQDGDGSLDVGDQPG